MAQHINSYFIEQGLFDEKRLVEHCERHLVWIHKSQKFPHLAILHYSDECQYDDKWSTFAKSCRGLVVDLENKKLLAIPYFKFHNLGESRAPSYKELLKLGSFETSEKLDGSMGIAFRDPKTGEFHITTKGSFDSEQGEWATQYARQHLDPRLMDRKLLDRYTLMFEIIYYSNRIVVDYEKKGYPEGLYLIGVRENQSQKLLSYNEVRQFAQSYNLPCIKTYKFSNLDEVVDQSKTLPFLEEGYVIRFNSNGLMLKIKGPEYLRVHRFLSKLDDKNLLECLINGNAKEVIDAAPEEYRAEVVTTIEGYRQKAALLRNRCYELFAQAPKTSRKEFALWVQANVDRDLQKFVFKLMDNKPLELLSIYQHFRVRREKMTDNFEVEIESPGLVAMVGVAGSGKSTLCKKLFPAAAIISSDRIRELLQYGEGDILASREEYQQLQTLNEGTFKILHSWVEARLIHHKLAVVDATNLTGKARRNLENLATKHKVPITYLVVQTDPAVCKERNRGRQYPVPDHVIDKHAEQLTKVVEDLAGSPNVVLLNSKNIDQLKVHIKDTRVQTQVSSAEAATAIPFTKVDAIGDIHGCLDDLKALLTKLGYKANSKGLFAHPEGRIFLSVGDVVDRGPQAYEALVFVRRHVEAGLALMVMGNHDNKFMRYLQGRSVTVSHGLGETIKQIPSGTNKEDMAEFLRTQTKYYYTMNVNGKTTVFTHAAFKPEYLGKFDRAIKGYCLYGPSAGVDTRTGLPKRIPWEEKYQGDVSVVYGHTVKTLGEANVANNTYGIDGGCVFGGKLFALRVPEFELVSVPAIKAYAQWIDNSEPQTV